MQLQGKKYYLDNVLIFVLLKVYFYACTRAFLKGL